MKGFWKRMWNKMIKWTKFSFFWQLLTSGIIVFVVACFYHDLVVHYIELVICWFIKDSEITRNVIYFFAAVIGAYLLYQRTKAAKEDVETAKKVLTTERLARAIEQLASDKPSVRLGGIRSLEQIADDYKEERTRIIQVLVARIRELVELKKEEQLIIKDEDIEIAFTALANIAKPLGKQKGKFFKLFGIDLSGLSFSHIDLSYFPLKNVILREVYFLEVNFTGTDLDVATINKTTFNNCEGLTRKQIMDALWKEGGRPNVLPEEWDLPITNLHAARQ